jgi:hypothetical protein
MYSFLFLLLSSLLLLLLLHTYKEIRIYISIALFIFFNPSLMDEPELQQADPF